MKLRGSKIQSMFYVSFTTNNEGCHYLLGLHEVSIVSYKSKGVQRMIVSERLADGRITLIAEDDSALMTQEDWFNCLKALMTRQFDIIELSTLRDKQQDLGLRHGKPYRATREEAEAYIREWDEYKKKCEEGREPIVYLTCCPPIAKKEEYNEALEEFLEKPTSKANTSKAKTLTVERDTTKVVGWRTVVGADGKEKANEPIYSIKKWNV